MKPKGGKMPSNVGTFVVDLETVDPVAAVGTGELYTVVGKLRDGKTAHQLERLEERRRQFQFAQRTLSVDYGFDEDHQAIARNGQTREWVRWLDISPSGMVAQMESAYDEIRNRDLAAAYANVVPDRPKVDAPSRESLRRVPVETIDLQGETAQLAADAEALLGYAPLRAHLKAPSLLRRVLAELDVEIFDQSTVDAYKAQMVAHYETHGKMVMPTWRLKPLRGMTDEVPMFALRKAVEIKRRLPQAEFYVDQLAVDPFLIVSLAPLRDSVVNVTSRNLDPEIAAYIEVWDEPGFEASH
jgi:hypothetical protein